MNLDLVVLALLGFGALVGFLAGFVRQLSSLVGWAAAASTVWFASRPFAEALGRVWPAPWLARLLVAGFILGVLARVGGSVAFSLFLSELGKADLFRRARGEKKKKSSSVPDRLLGAGFGAAKAGAAAWVGLSVAAFVALVLGDLGVRVGVQGSEAWAYATERNALVLAFEKPTRDFRAQLRQLSAELDNGTRVSPSITAVAKDPKIQRVTRDGQLAAAAARGDLAAVARSDAFGDLFADPRVAEQLLAAISDIAAGAGIIEAAPR